MKRPFLARTQQREDEDIEERKAQKILRAVHLFHVLGWWQISSRAVHLFCVAVRWQTHSIMHLATLIECIALSTLQGRGRSLSESSMLMLVNYNNAFCRVGATFCRSWRSLLWTLNCSRKFRIHTSLIQTDLSPKKSPRDLYIPVRKWEGTASPLKVIPSFMLLAPRSFFFGNPWMNCVLKKFCYLWLRETSTVNEKKCWSMANTVCSRSEIPKHSSPTPGEAATQKAQSAGTYWHIAPLVVSPSFHSLVWIKIKTIPRAPSLGSEESCQLESFQGWSRL